MYASKGRVLIVDDTPYNVELLQDLLEGVGYEVIPATEAESTFHQLPDFAPDLILLDIMMPYMDGFTFCKKMKADPRTADIPVIFISALDDLDNMLRGFEVGAVDYITKPFQQPEVLARVNSQMTLVHQRRDIEARHQQQLHYYETLNTMKAHFIQSATHDLKNPLHIIIGYANLLLEFEPGEFEEKGEKLVHNILEGAEKMRHLIAEMLDLAQMQTGTDFLAIQATPIQRLIEKNIESYQALAQQKNVRLSCQYEGDPPTVKADPNKLGRALENLIANAIKYTPAGGYITTRVGCEDNRAYIIIEDSGLGIPADALPHLFTPFYRVDNDTHRQEEGSGLGLSIVKSIIEHHQGQISVDSTEGHGSTFTLYLPCAD